MIRELNGLGGLSLADFSVEQTWSATPLGQRLALMKVVPAQEDSATTLHNRIPGISPRARSSLSFRTFKR